MKKDKCNYLFLNKQIRNAIKQILSNLELKEQVNIGTSKNKTINIFSSSSPKLEQVSFRNHKLTRKHLKRNITRSVNIFSSIKREKLPGDIIGKFSDGSDAISYNGSTLNFNFNPFSSFIHFIYEFGIKTNSYIEKMIFMLYNSIPHFTKNIARIVFRSKDNVIKTPSDFIGASNNVLTNLIEDFLLLENFAVLKSHDTSIILSHDVDNHFFSNKSDLALPELLKRHKVPSSWFFIPFSPKYCLTSSFIKSIAPYDIELGIHGYSHDGLLDKSSPRKLDARIKESKKKFKALAIDTLIFRSPYMMRSSRILESLQNNGYRIDSSYPDKNTLSLTKKQPGIEYNRPYFPLYNRNKNDIGKFLVEIPSTYPQDVQLLNDYKLGRQHALEYWKYKFDFIKDYRGTFVFHGHPIYLSKNLDLYDKLINYMKKQNATFKTFKEVGEEFRNKYIEIDNCDNLIINM